MIGKFYLYRGVFMGFFSRKKKENDFPFNEPVNLGVFTCKHIVDYGASILFVHHSEDGDWEFWCDKEHTMNDVVVTALGVVYATFRVNRALALIET
jgi:hypothetical protein